MDYALCRRFINLSPNSFRTSLPLDVRWDMIDRFFYEFMSFSYKSWILDSYVRVDPFIWSVTFYIVSPRRTSYINKTVIFYLSFEFWLSKAYEFPRSLVIALSVLISLNWSYCCLLTYFNASLKPTISEDIMILLSILGTYFITKFYSSLSLTIILDSRLECL